MSMKIARAGQKLFLVLVFLMSMKVNIDDNVSLLNFIGEFFGESFY